MIDVRTSLGRANSVHKGYLTESVRGWRHKHFPAVILVLDEWKVGIHVNILFKVLSLEFLGSQTHLGGRPSSGVINALFEDRLHLVKGGTEPSPVGLESDTDHILGALLLLDDWRVTDRHVILPRLRVHLAIVHDNQVKLFAKDVGQLGSIPVSATDNPLLLVIIV